MYLQEILEVAIGLVFVWLVLSVATMSLQEWLGNIANLRGKEMKKTITQLLSSKDLTQEFYQHPLIASLYTLPKNPRKKPRYPSYIPAPKFSAAIFDLVIKAGTEDSPVQAMTGEIDKHLASIQSPEGQKLARQDWNVILDSARNIVASGLGTAALDSLKLQIKFYGEKYPEAEQAVAALGLRLDAYYGQFVQGQRSAVEPGVDGGLSLRQFRLGMLGLQKINPRFFETVSALVRQAEVNALGEEQVAASLKTNIETWFNDAMQRLSGAYKRRAQWTAFLVGIIMALILNVDSINVATSLWREPTLRQAIIAQAQSYAPPATSQGSPTASPLESIPAMEAQLQALNIPFGWTTGVFDTGSRLCTILPFQANKAWGIPSQNDQGLPICKNLNNLPPDIYGWLVKVLGILITGAAAAQGAPFWFDMLGKLVNVRGTGANPAEKQAVG